MRQSAIQHPPYVHFFFVFGALGGLLISIALAGSPVGVFTLLVPVIFAPSAILISSVNLLRRHRDSTFHSVAFWAGLAYVAMIVLVASVGALLQP